MDPSRLFLLLGQKPDGCRTERNAVTQNVPGSLVVVIGLVCRSVRNEVTGDAVGLNPEPNARNQVGQQQRLALDVSPPVKHYVDEPGAGRQQRNVSSIGFA